ncbi:uncharacterized protein LOC122672060 [Telopea speciosissima]|uniref:uncharacterized protein LOC122672060 n=1 Tax=Telopea speciosissima TaxID=54955 RepID=UPI001CC4B6F1|nr:uncharacterized protein LOC122672060 [Telopea speciosissima]
MVAYFCLYELCGTNKNSQFETLKSLSAFIDKPWILAGDWNSYLNFEDKKGGRPLTNTALSSLNEFANSACISPIHHRGYQFTRSNGQFGVRRIDGKLDRVFSNGNWFNLFPNATVSTEVMASSDHRAIILHPDRTGTRSPQPFRFEALWLLETSFLDVVARTWLSRSPRGSPSFIMSRKLVKLQHSLRVWNHS